MTTETNIAELLEERDRLEQEHQLTIWSKFETIFRGAIDDTANKFKTLMKSRDNSLEGYGSFFTNQSESAYQLHYRYKQLQKVYDSIMFYSEEKECDPKYGLACLNYVDNEVNELEGILLRVSIIKHSTDVMSNHAHLLMRDAQQILLSDYRQWAKHVRHETAVYVYDIEENRKAIDNLKTK
jgi:hypothetical protein